MTILLPELSNSGSPPAEPGVYLDANYVQKEDPALIAIDAPLNLPLGRKSIEDRNGEHFRPCDRELLKRGIRFFPITLGPMRLLTKRGIHLKRVLTRRGYAVIEVYPGAAQDIWRTGRKQNGLSKLRHGLQELGVKGLNKKMGGDELDAVTAALVGQLFLLGKAEVLGNFKQGAIVVPNREAMKRFQREVDKKERGTAPGLLQHLL
jgi:predicted nuclease with RNAse H fold